jgi:hypothetical protein
MSSYATNHHPNEHNNNNNTCDYRPEYDTSNPHKSGYQTTQTTASGSSYATYGVYGDVAQSSGSNLAGISSASTANGSVSGTLSYRKPDAKRKVCLAPDLVLLLIRSSSLSLSTLFLSAVPDGLSSFYLFSFLVMYSLW